MIPIRQARTANESLEQPHEIRSWTESLGVTEQQPRAAVAAVGNSADKVREYLRKGK